MTAPKPTPSKPRRVWVVKQKSGGETLYRADYWRTVERRDGLELVFLNRDPEIDRKVGGVNAGSWHWVSEENSIVEEESDE